MKFSYAGQDYELLEMVEPNKTFTSGLLVILKVKYVVIGKDYQEIDVGKNGDYEFESYDYINYFCDQENEKDNLIIAMQYIDEYLKKDGKTK